MAFERIAEAIGQGLKLPAQAMSAQDAAAHFGWFAMFATMEAPTSSEHTRNRLGWAPTGPGLIDDMEQAG